MITTHAAASSCPNSAATIAVTAVSAATTTCPNSAGELTHTAPGSQQG